MKYALVNQMIATLYSKPKEDQLTHDALTSNILDEVLYGMPVEILEICPNNWVKVRTYYRYEGYLPLSALYLLSKQEWQEWQDQKAKKRFVTKSAIDIIACPKVSGIRLRTVTRGAILTLIENAENRGGWVKVCLNDGTEGYTKEEFLDSFKDDIQNPDENELRQKVVQTALSYLGTQYRWGGKSPMGIDCSGLVSMAYLLNGVIIFRDAKIKEGFSIHEISFEHKKPGDLFFYPGHVVMYIGGNRYIHSTARDGSDGVVLNSLNVADPDYRADLVEQMCAVGSVF